MGKYTKLVTIINYKIADFKEDKLLVSVDDFIEFMFKTIWKNKKRISFFKMEQDIKAIQPYFFKKTLAAQTVTNFDKNILQNFNDYFGD